MQQMASTKFAHIGKSLYSLLYAFSLFKQRLVFHSVFLQQSYNLYLLHTVVGDVGV